MTILLIRMTPPFNASVINGNGYFVVHAIGHKKIGLQYKHILWLNGSNLLF